MEESTIRLGNGSKVGFLRPVSDFCYRQQIPNFEEIRDLFESTFAEI